MKKLDKNSNALCGETSQVKGSSKRFLLRQYQDTEALEEIKDYEDSTTRSSFIEDEWNRRVKNDL